MKNELNNNDENLVGFIVSPPKITIENEAIDTNKTNTSFFSKGDIVKVERLPNSPLMLVTEIVFQKDDSGEIVLDNFGNRILIGIKCGWFTANAHYLTEVWNTKDILVVRPAPKKTYTI